MCSSGRVPAISCLLRAQSNDRAHLTFPYSLYVFHHLKNIGIPNGFAPSGRKYKSGEMGKIQFAQGMWLRIAVLILPRFCGYPILDFATACQLLGEYHHGVFFCFTA
jgi:hypothetical protein